MPDVREKLVELLGNLFCGDYVINGCDSCKYNTEVMCSAHACADRLIANGVTIQRWIPVEERMPEESGKYLCVVKSSLFLDATYQEILGYDKGGFHDGCICMDDVSHWMPLPEPPKEE